MSEMNLAPVGSPPPISPAGTRYPIEPSFLWPFVITALLVLAPSLVALVRASDGRTISRFYQIFWGNWVSPVILWLFAATLLYLLRKRSLLRAEVRATRSFTERVVPGLLVADTRTESPEDLCARLEEDLVRLEVPKAAQNLLLGRCRSVLTAPASRVATEEDRRRLAEAAGEFDRSFMVGSYALARYMTWAIPIWGFIGTVWGISAAVSHFSDAMAKVDSASGVSQTLKESLPLVTQNLATAFDTTFVALVLSLPVVLLTTWLEKREDAYLTELDRLWMRDVLPRLPLPGAAPATSAGAAHRGQGDASVQAVAEELRLLSLHVKALHAVMTEIHEASFDPSVEQPAEEP